ncbi:hypothetical protein QAD02_023810 [Eretmocerus hayati]|uniref:Uncharacterized protein n=1 Tax=Eretmocerus hayati TaxID=131215 RepID=A0ACC2PWP8_9HYME|nr:hypothetical protein QAD02_023810 [Eretmocerus hayati]
MADSFFGFDTSLGAGVDDGLDCLEDEDFEENNYDALNDETFGSEATVEDWEQDHEKLAQITESSRPHLRNELTKSEQEIDVEKSLSHLVLDDKLTIPKPGVWDGPTSFPIAPPQIRPKPSLSATLKNACTVEELERGLITNRPPPGLIKQQPTHSLPSSGQNPFLNSLTSAEKLPQINGVAPSPNQFPFIFPPNVRLPHAQFPHLQNIRLPNQPGNNFRCPVPPPHLLMQLGGRQLPFHGNFPPNNFPHHHHPGMGPMPFMRPDHLLLPHHLNNHQSIPHHFRNQNKHFNHSDRQDNHHQPFFKNNQYHQNMNHLNRFFQGHHHLPMFPHMMNNHHNNHSTNGFGPSGEYDEYAGLMNNREKQWLNNIQLLQLNTNQPYIDDYYYTVFCDRLNKKNQNKNRERTDGRRTPSSNNNNNNGFFRDSRDKEQPQHTFTKNANAPMQFENSLGKLQYSSVTAPRKIIDMDVVSNNDSQQSSTNLQKDMKRTRQLLLEIERLYMLLLKLEDKNNPLAILADQQREQQLKEQQQEGGETVSESEPRDLVRERQELVSSIMTPLLQAIQEDKFASFLSIRKGKTLFLRFLACIDVKEHELKLAKLWAGVIKGLVMIGRRDSHMLSDFYTEFHKWVESNCISSVILIDLSKEFVDSTSQPSKSNSLAFALSNKFGISVISLMLKHANERSMSSKVKLHESFATQWSLFLDSVADCIVSSAPTVDPYQILNAETLNAHLKLYGVESEVKRAAFQLYFTEANPTR